MEIYILQKRGNVVAGNPFYTNVQCFDSIEKAMSHVLYKLKLEPLNYEHREQFLSQKQMLFGIKRVIGNNCELTENNNVHRIERMTVE